MVAVQTDTAVDVRRNAVIARGVMRAALAVESEVPLGIPGIFPPP